MGADYMTRVDGYPSTNQAKSGMAYFSDTGPFGTVCGKCAFFEPHGRAGYCKKYLEMAKAWGAQIRKRQSSCKYYQQKAKP
jgi:hypothetical protein